MASLMRPVVFSIRKPWCAVLGARAYTRLVADDRELISADDLDLMTPDERARAFDEHLVADLDEVPPEFRARIVETARRLSVELPTAPPR